MQKFNYENAQFEYEPYPICYIPNFINETDYKELSESYPPLDLFLFRPVLGSKYVLSEHKNNPKNYYDFLKRTPCWRDFAETIKRKAFVQEINDFVKANNIDLGLKGINRYWYEPKLAKKTRGPVARLFNKKVMRSRFDFSVMPANGGHILPHTDDPRKYVTLVLSFIKPNEWDESWGGGTDVLKPIDVTKTYNHVNFQMPFDQVKHVKTFPFKPNQCLLFIKTYNSWHSVTPMTGPATGLRKTITINIENII